ncbi:hypothetical protein AACH06_28950 [Ideonella sp. DXS29W]|uniref:DUF4145 domain-containing protein n=1 Tax=Ideonella lacteola TaxID=2984193 RepID=A0ABU9BY85_9BURK
MASNLERFKADLEKLILKGRALHLSMQHACYPDKVKAALKKELKEETEKYLRGLPDFDKGYQRWYTEAQAVVKQLIPDRLIDFIRHYEKPKPRKDITFENYRIEDYLQGLRVTRGGFEVVVNKEAAIPQFQQQLAILEAAQARFDSSLLDMRQMLQADLFDSELQAAEHLAKFKFGRAAGALAGVVLERHLSQVCVNHSLTIGKKNPTIADFNEALKAADVIDLPQWRFVQHLADLRNLCDHAKKPDPSAEQIQDLLAGVAKVTKTVF